MRAVIPQIAPHRLSASQQRSMLAEANAERIRLDMVPVAPTQNQLAHLLEPPPARRVAVPSTLVVPVERTDVQLFGDVRYPSKQLLPIAPVLRPLSSEQRSLLPTGAWNDDYFVQPKEFSDDELIQAYGMSVHDERGAESDAMSDGPTRTRQGTAELPAPTLRVRPFHFRHVRFAQPDYPSPSVMQEGLRREEQNRLRQQVRQLQIQQEAMMRQVRQYQQAAIEAPPQQPAHAQRKRHRAR